MIVIGLTGPTGAGKSTVAAMLRERGLYVADADAVAREILCPGSPVLQALSEAFGGDILHTDGTLDRKTLSQRAFASEESVHTLNRLTHPVIGERLFARIAANASGRAAVIDGAALIESGIADRCDLLAVVLAPQDVRLSRIRQRDGLTQDEALLRIRAQQADSFYTARADVVLYNDGVRDLAPQVQTLMERIPLA